MVLFIPAFFIPSIFFPHHSMAPVPKNSIHDHFIHPGHTLTIDNNHQQEYLCDGCKTPGVGKRYRCNPCDFDLHEYCATCPRILSSFMHKAHALTLVMRKPSQARQVNRICNVCSDPVEGLFYRCKDCEFDLHPLCTQLPDKVQHALHKIHPLDLRSSEVVGFCAVCRGLCKGWRYRCGLCGFDIHLECVLLPAAKSMDDNVNAQRGGVPGFGQGIPFQPPQFMPYYGCPNYGPGFNVYGQNQFMYPNNFTPQTVSDNNNNGRSRFGKSMFSLVGQLGSGVLSNMVFGVDLSQFV